LFSNDLLGVIFALLVFFMGWLINRLGRLSTKISEMNGSVREVKEWKSNHIQGHMRDATGHDQTHERDNREMSDLRNSLRDVNSQLVELYRMEKHG
jgi:hypothetical protein